MAFSHPAPHWSRDPPWRLLAALGVFLRPVAPSCGLLASSGTSATWWGLVIPHEDGLGRHLAAPPSTWGNLEFCLVLFN
jgi:hypothetical protein